jgi:hypothetical protein
LTKENSNLQKEHSIVSNNQTNGNFYKKEASKSGFITGNEKYIFFRNGKSEKVKNEAMSKEDKYPVDMSHLRILWIVVSVIITLFYFWHRSRERKVDKGMDGNF